jgi:hypothetical protein
MTDPFAIFRSKSSTGKAAMILGVLLLLPASLGLGGTIVEDAYAQFNLPTIPGEEDTTPTAPEEDTTPTAPEEDTTPTAPEEDTTPTPIAPQGTENGVSFLLRGFIGSTLPTQGGVDTPPGGSENTHVVTGRFRIFANESLIHRFIAEMNLASIDGTSNHNVTIEETVPHRFELTSGVNGTTTAPSGQTPPVSSDMRARIYVDSSVPIVDDVRMMLSIRGDVLALDGIDIDETRVADTGIRDILSAIDGQSIYGTIPR